MKACRQGHTVLCVQSNFGIARETLTVTLPHPFCCHRDEQEPQVAVVRLNNPGKLNALTEDMGHAFQAVVAQYCVQQSGCDVYECSPSHAPTDHSRPQ